VRLLYGLQRLAIGDYNGSGTSDILFRNNAAGDTGFYQMVNGANVGRVDVDASSTGTPVAGHAGGGPAGLFRSH
jgi:hypothetical protein